MGVQEKVAAEEFSIMTSKKPHEIRAAGQRAIESGRRFLTSTVKEGVVTDSTVQYGITGPGGMVRQMEIKVSWQETALGMRRVTLEVPNYLTVRETIMFIPVSPKRAPALGSLKKFSETLRRSLA